MTGFIDVVLRGLALAAQAIAIGGVAFVLLLSLRPSAVEVDRAQLVPRTFRLVTASAAALAVVQIAVLTDLLIALGTADLATLIDVVRTSYVRASAVKVIACVAIAMGAWAAASRTAAAGRTAVDGRTALGGRAALALTAPVLLLVAAAAWTSHAAARLDGRPSLMGVDALHQLAAGVWIGGLFHLLVATLRDPGRRWPMALLKRFSIAAVGAVAVLVAAGSVLTWSYVDGVRAVVGTSYGIMLLTKIVILGGLLGLGGLNFVTIRRARASRSNDRIRRFVEVEIGLGITALFVAASLTSLPIAADVQADRATPAEVASRFTPRPPALTSPPIAALPIDDRNAPRTDADRAWSEYNHHMAGAFVVFMAVLAIIDATGHARWARHWPLTFLGLAAFLLVRDDPGAWPLGPDGFWESMRYPEVLQHRVFVALVVLFGVFEWMVRTRRLRSPRCALVFPLLCAVSGTLLLTHSHANLDIKTEFLTEITHAPLALLGLAVGWGRWLELRLPSPEGGLSGRLAAWSFALVGVLLLIYRES